MKKILFMLLISAVSPFAHADQMFYCSTQKTAPPQQVLVNFDREKLDSGGNGQGSVTISSFNNGTGTWTPITSLNKATAQIKVYWTQDAKRVHAIVIDMGRTGKITIATKGFYSRYDSTEAWVSGNLKDFNFPEGIVFELCSYGTSRKPAGMTGSN